MQITGIKRLTVDGVQYKCKDHGEMKGGIKREEVEGATASVVKESHESSKLEIELFGLSMSDYLGLKEVKGVTIVIENSDETMSLTNAVSVSSEARKNEDGGAKFAFISDNEWITL